MTIRREKFTNGIETTLNGAINSSTTTVVLTDASTFPVSFFRIKIEDEIMYVTSRSSNTLTVIRGYEGTTGASHADGLAVNHTITAGALAAFRRSLLSDAGDIVEDESVSSDDDDFDDENYSGWTTVQGSPNATITERNHRLSILIPAGSSAAQHYGMMKAKSGISAGDYIQCGLNVGGGSGGFPIPGLGFADGATYGSGKQVQFSFSPNENQFFIRSLTGYNTQKGDEAGGGGEHSHFMKVLHLRMVWNSSNNYDCLCSPDGISWAYVFANQTRNSIGTPTHAGIITTNWGSSNNHVHSYTYFRYSW